MQTFQDYGGRQVVLTEFAEQHIVGGHREIGVLGLYKVIGETVASPDLVVSYSRALHYFRMYRNTPFGDKYVRVVATEADNVRYIRTAFVTGRVVKGLVIWERGM